MVSVHRKAPGSGLLGATTNLPNQPLRCHFLPLLRFRVESAGAQLAAVEKAGATIRGILDEADGALPALAEGAAEE